MFEGRKASGKTGWTANIKIETVSCPPVLDLELRWDEEASLSSLKPGFRSDIQTCHTSVRFHHFSIGCAPVHCVVVSL